MSRTTTAVGVSTLLVLLFYFEYRLKAHNTSVQTADRQKVIDGSVIESRAMKEVELQKLQEERLENKAKIAALEKQLQDAESDAEEFNDSVRPDPQIAIDYQSLWSAAHCVNHRLAQRLAPIFARNQVRKIDSTTRIEERLGPPGILVPYEIRVSKEKGRGVYATRAIPRGTMVIQATREVKFKQGEFNAFLECIPDKQLKSDVVRWAWSSVSDGYQFLSLSLDDSSLVNNCDEPTTGVHWAFNETAQQNSLGLVMSRVRADRVRIPTESNTHALRDIAPGEELCDRYDTYDVGTENHWFRQMVPEDGQS